jgi:hypothetical protein
VELELKESVGVDLTGLGRRFIESLGGLCGFEERFHVKVDEGTGEGYGWVPTMRPIAKYIEYGVVNLDKPPGPTSHEVVAWVKRLLNVQKAGHGGTLELPVF